MLIFWKTILKSNYAVKGVRVLGILAEVTRANKLELLARFSVGKGRLYHSVRELGKRIGIEEIEIGLALGNVGGVLNVEETVVKHKGCRNSIFSREPMHGALDLASVSRHTVASFKVGCCGVIILQYIT